MHNGSKMCLTNTSEFNINIIDYIFLFAANGNALNSAVAVPDILYIHDLDALHRFPRRGFQFHRVSKQPYFCILHGESRPSERRPPTQTVLPRGGGTFRSQHSLENAPGVWRRGEPIVFSCHYNHCSSGIVAWGAWSLAKPNPEHSDSRKQDPGHCWSHGCWVSSASGKSYEDPKDQRCIRQLVLSPPGQCPFLPAGTKPFLKFCKRGNWTVWNEYYVFRLQVSIKKTMFRIHRKRQSKSLCSIQFCSFLSMVR
jgi:hypothetical protein